MIIKILTITCQATVDISVSFGRYIWYGNDGSINNDYNSEWLSLRCETQIKEHAFD